MIALPLHWAWLAVAFAAGYAAGQWALALYLFLSSRREDAKDPPRTGTPGG